MTVVTRINQIKKSSPELYFSIIEANNWIDYELSKLIADEGDKPNSSLSPSIKEQLQERLFLLGENANRRAMLARNKGNMQSWLIWDKIVTTIDFVCEWLERDRVSSSYFLH